MRNAFHLFMFVFGLVSTISAVLHWVSGDSAADVYGGNIVWTALVMLFFNFAIQGLIRLLNQEVS